MSHLGRLLWPLFMVLDRMHIVNFCQITMLLDVNLRITMFVTSFFAVRVSSTL